MTLQSSQIVQSLIPLFLLLAPVRQVKGFINSKDLDLLLYIYILFSLL